MEETATRWKPRARRAGPVHAGLGLAIVATALAAAPVVAPEGRAGTVLVADRTVALADRSEETDPYFPTDGNHGYSVDHYDLRLRVDPSARLLRGRAWIHATAETELERLNLDFKLSPTVVRVDGARASFVRRGAHELVITPATVLAPGERFVVAVRYAGRPQRVRVDGYRPWQFSDRGSFVNGEPHHAVVWYPVNDHPRDKATYRTTVSVPRGWEGLSAGRLVDRRSVGRRTLWTWRVDQPMASFLNYLGVGQYQLRRVTSGGLSGRYALPDSMTSRKRERVMESLELTPEFAQWLARRLGPYPFDSIGATVVNDFRVSTIESQATPVYGTYIFEQYRRQSARTVFHEVAHQWWGNSVTMRRWSDLWLHEGFAHYSTWWWSALSGNGPSLDKRFCAAYNAVPADDRWWTIPPGDPGPDLSDLFLTVYDRGAMALHAISNIVGARAFRALLRAWAQARELGHGTTEEFESLAEEMTGHELSHLFETWLYKRERPDPVAGNGLPVGLCGVGNDRASE